MAKFDIGATIRCKLDDGIIADGRVMHIGAASRGDDGFSYAMLTITVTHPITSVDRVVYTAVSDRELAF